MSHHTDEAYFKWLYSQIGSPRSRNTARTHWAFARQLYKKEFLWFVPNDDNRAEDGRDLRHEFISVTGTDPSDEWMSLGCSMLEMLIALSRHLAFLANGDSLSWFWEMVENLNIPMSWVSDAHYNEEISDTVDAALDRVIFRTYEGNGEGGLFPLQNPKEDQRGIELWYQLNAYVIADMED